MPKKTNYLVTKGGRHYFRIRIPDVLRAGIGNKEHSEAIGDLNKAQAEIAAARLGADWLARFLDDRHRLGIAPSPSAPAKAIPAAALHLPTMTEVQAMATLAGRSMFAADAHSRIEGTLWDIPEGFGPGADLANALPEAIAGRSMEGLAKRVEDWLGGQGLALPAKSLI